MSSPAVSSSMLAPSGSMNDVSALADHPTTDGVTAYAEDPKDKEEEDEPQAMQGPEVLQVHPKKFEISLRLNMSYHLELKLKNISQSVVAFKVKTTAPKRYMVRPTQDCIAPGETKTCQIIFAKLKEYPDVTKPRQLRDKFLVQSLALQATLTPEALQTLWKEKEAQHDPKNGRPLYYEHKIKCKLLVPVQERAAMASRLGGAQAAELDQQAAAVLLPASSGSLPESSTLPATTTALIESSITTATDPTPSVRVAADSSASASALDSQASTQPVVAPSAAAAQISVQEAYKKAKQYDELLDFTVRLTEESERMKEERKTLVDRFREGADEIKRLRSEVDSLTSKLRDAESRATAASQSAGAASEVEVIAGTGLRQRRTGNSVTVLENHAADQTSTQALDDKSAKGLHLELWQLIFLLIVVFFVGFFLS